LRYCIFHCLSIFTSVLAALMGSPSYGESIDLKMPPLPPSMIDRLSDPVAEIVFDTVFFESGASELSEPDRLAIYETGRKLLNLEVYVVIEAHTDSRGERDTNQKLSEARAATARAALLAVGVDPSRVISIGYGEDYASKEPNEKDRRVVFNLRKLKANSPDIKTLYVELRARGLRFEERGFLAETAPDPQNPVEKQAIQEPLWAFGLTRIASYPLLEFDQAAATGFFLWAKIWRFSETIALVVDASTTSHRVAADGVDGTVTQNGLFIGTSDRTTKSSLFHFIWGASFGVWDRNFSETLAPGLASRSLDEGGISPALQVFSGGFARIPRSANGGFARVRIAFDRSAISSSFEIGIARFHDAGGL